ncbi:MAG TPA: DUF4912 domain-containing protein [bacterium]|nr:DUF4912 domain-containing protein [bacterium]
MPRKKKETSETKPATPRKRRTAPAATDKAGAKAAPKPRARKAAAPKKASVEPKVVKAPKPKKEKAVQEPAGPALRRLPRKGETQMVAFVRDPNCIFTYWEVTPESAEEVRRQLMEEYPNSVMVLRLLRQDANGQMQLVQEIRVKPGEMNRYVDLAGDPGNFVVEIAQKAPSGKTVVYARSKPVHTGPGAPWTPGQVPDLLGAPGEEIPRAFLDYFEEGEVESVRTHPAGVISSAEAFRLEVLRRKGREDRYAASRHQ